MLEYSALRDRIIELTGWETVSRPKVVTDTTDCMRIQRGHVLQLDDRQFVIQGNRYETRFGIEDQPKYWVFAAIDLETGKKKIIKTIFHEDFHVHIGVFKIHCYRSPDKESKVLHMVEGDDRFMQGYSTVDSRGNNVRVMDFIRGPSIFQYVANIPKTHEQYYYEDLPAIMWKLLDSLEALQFLHERGTCHGDVRNDHIMIEKGTGHYRWIDFDLNQHVSDFDVWSMGNIINYAVGKGINSFQQVSRSDDFSDEIKNSLVYDDASAFYLYRIMNLGKLFPYIPPQLTDVLRHFTVVPKSNYANAPELLNDYRDMLEAEFPDGKPRTEGPSNSDVA